MAIFIIRKYREMRTILLSLLSIAICSSIYGQVSFVNGQSQVLGDELIYSTICIGVDDINGDLLDDLILLDDGKILKTFIQGAPNQPFAHEEHLQVSAFGDWAIVSGDIDNDDVPEIISSGVEDGSQFLKYDGEKYSTIFNVGDVYSQNTNLVDLDNDGFLDFFVCNDHGENLMFLNNGSGGMVATKLIDFQTTPEDDMSGNYSSIFTDIDGDDDLDLYIGKCRAGVDDSSDPRRINTLYINNGDGTYTESGEAFGVNNGAQSWSIDAGDIDNDGDTDLIVAHHNSPHDLYVNDGNGHFDSKVLLQCGDICYATQSFFCDFDNNGWLDIFITDISASYILFNDEMSFSRRDIVEEGRQPFSGAYGDFNSDGFPDLYLGFANSFQDASMIADRIFLNETNTNNYLDINLIGTVSNRDAIGAKVYIHQGDRIQYREIIAGKSYGIMNTTIAHFGLGQTTEVDSIHIKWPSGEETVINDVPAINTLMSVTEGGCITSTYHMPDLQLCNGDSIEVVLPTEYNNFKWSNGSTEANTWISEAGWYNVEFEINGCLTRSSYFEVTEEKQLEQGEVLSQIEIAACDGDVVELEAHPGIAYYWSTDETTQVIEVTESGVYNVSMATNCANYDSGDANVFFADTKIPEVENDSVVMGTSATFVGDSEALNWYQNKIDLEPIATGSEFETPAISEDQTYYVGEVTEGFGFNKSLMKTVPLNNVGDSIYSENDFVEIEVLDKLILYSVKVRTQQAGIRRIVIMQENEELYSADKNLLVGVNTVNIDFQLEPGIYKIGTDTELNQTNFGTDHPQLSYSEIYTENDKLINGYLEVGESDLYPGVSPHFFDWEIYYGYYYCEPRVPVHAIVKTPVSTSELSTNSYIYPNPTSGQLNIRTEMDLPIKIDVYDISGAKVMKTIHGSEPHVTIDMPAAAGMYIIKLTNNLSSQTKKIYVH